MKRLLSLLVLVSILVAGLPATSADQPDDDLSKLVAGNNAFALDFYRHRSAATNNNVIVSPFSISQAFGMLMGGARDVTARQIAAALHYELPQDKLHPAFAVLNAELRERTAPDMNGDGQRLQLNVANSLWAQQDFPFRDSYIALVEDYYDGALYFEDFARSPDQVRQTINTWIADKTEGKIEDMLSPGMVNPNTRMMLVNAIYFNASWQHPFEEDLTQDDTFMLLDGSTVTVPMMTQRASFAMMQGENFQAVELPYYGEDMAMLIIMPDEGQFDIFRAEFGTEQFDTVRNGLSHQQLELTMPRFEFKTKLDLTPALSALGMVDVFDPTRADLTGMFDPDAAGENLFVSAVIHEAYIGVDEAGTEAAAATAMGFTTAAPTEVQTLRLDRPFIYAIYDRQSGAILFMGHVMNPAQ
jgi:serpin B